MKAEDEGRRRGRRRAALALVTMFLVGGPALGSVVLASWHSAQERSTPILGVVSLVVTALGLFVLIRSVRRLRAS